MSLPIDMYFVRHGESEGNVANKHSRKGDNKHFTPEFLARHSGSWRLTDKGITQAKAAGNWFKSEGITHFDRYTVSSYNRALETAALLNLPEAEWKSEYYLREREWGELDNMPDDERHSRFQESLARREADAFYWRPPGGESLAEASLRVDRHFSTAHRSNANGRSITVCHGEIMWIVRIRLERMTQREFARLDASKHPHDRIHNCQILHYSRRDELGRTHPHMVRMRSICPWDMSHSSNVWTPILRPSFTNDDLLSIVSETKRMVS